MSLNGEKMLPTIHVGWDAEHQVVRLAFDDQEFKTWNFVIANLEMALQLAKDNHQMQVAQKRMQLMQQQVQNQVLAQEVAKGIQIGR
jgi:phenylalanine-4-hydroxylase